MVYFASPSPHHSLNPGYLNPILKITDKSLHWSSVLKYRSTLSFKMAYWAKARAVVGAQFHKTCKHKNLLSTEKYCLAETGLPAKIP